MMAGDHLTDFYRGISMKIKLFLAVILLLTVVLLPYCVWQSNIATDADGPASSNVETAARMQDEEGTAKPEYTVEELVFDPMQDYGYCNLHYHPADVYCYDKLTEAQRLAYRMLAYAVDSIVSGEIREGARWTLESDVTVVNSDVETARELFCANYYVLKGIADSIEVDCNIFKKQTVFTYIATEDAQRDVGLYLLCLDKAQEIFKKIDMTAPQEKIAYEIAEYISEYGEYDAEYTVDNIVYGMLTDKKGICEGFAYTYDFLCKKAGLNVITATATRGDYYHVWCMIILDGEWYNVDPTWMTTMNDGCDYFLFDDVLRSRYQRTKMSDTCYYYDYSKNKAFNAPTCTDASKNEQ